MSPLDLVPMMSQKLSKQLATLTIAIAALAWIGGAIAISTGMQSDTVSVPDPAAVMKYLSALAEIPTATWFETGAEWLKQRNEIGVALAVVGGAVANGSALQRGPLRSGGGAVWAWVCLMLAATSLGVAAAVGWGCLGFLPFLLIAMLWAALSRESDEATVVLITWGSLGEKLMMNVVQFVMLPFLPFILLPWLSAAYGYELGTGLSVGDDPRNRSR